MANASSGGTSAQKLFCGWIPTVSGRLSFSVFGDCKHPTVATYENIADDKIRYVAAHQFRDASDVLLPFRSWLSPLVFGIDGRMWFVFLAHTESKSDDPLYLLVGRAFIFADLLRWKNHVSEKLFSFQGHLRSFEYHKDNDDLEAHARNEFNDTMQYCSQQCSFFVDVKIRRNGVTEILPATSSSLPLSAPKLPDDPKKNSRAVRLLVSQLFFFLKDLGHRHQHHQPSTDQIVSIHETTMADDIQWRNLTLYSIYRRVIEIKRDPHIATVSNSLGLVAYAEAFTKILREDLNIAEDDKRIPAYYTDAMKDSIKSTQDRAERLAARSTRAWDIIRTTVISIAGLLVSYVGLLKLGSIETNVTPDPIILDLLGWLLIHPIRTCLVLVLLIGTMVVALNVNRGDVWPIYVRMTRQFNWMPRWLLGSIIAGVGLVNAYLFFFVFLT